MEKTLIKQPANNLQRQLTAKQEETLALANSIIKNSGELTMLELNLKIRDVINKPSLRSSFRGNDKIAFGVVNVIVSRFLDSFAFSTKFNSNQIDMLSVDVLENFQYESLEDVILFLKMARSGKFGATKRGVDSNLIFGEWFPVYMDLKAEQRERAHTENKKIIFEKQTTPEEIEENYKKQNPVKNLKTEIDLITKNYDRQMLEDLIIDWSKDPDKKEYLKQLKKKRKTIK